MAFYWYEGKKIELSKSTTHRAVRHSREITAQSQQRIMAALNVSAPDSSRLDVGRGIFLYKTSAPPQAPFAQPLVPEALPEDASELAVFASPSGSPIILTEEFNVQFKTEVTRQQIDEFNAQNKVKLVRESTWEKNAFLLAVQEDAGTDALTMANRYHDSGLTLYAEPNFVQLLKPAYVPDDTFFPQQWALKNTGQRRGIAGEDIRAVDAWEVTQGSPAITIAILDDGVDYTHLDLNTPGKLVQGYDVASGGDDPTPNTWDNHGTSCAGIAAAAADNREGISGVAPLCRIMGIRIAHAPASGEHWVSTSTGIADGIATAVNRGADVLSNSWGGGSPSTAITNAIRHAKDNGRGGQGCVVCFAAGNGNGPVNYPANLPEVIAVAACNQWGEHKSPTSRDGETWWGSNFGPEIDICAPGVQIHTTTNGGNYRDDFNGTSAATPHVAGVAALVLSVNPNLSAAQVEQILYNSADDIDAPGRDDFTGHGRVNAHRALQTQRSLSNRIDIGHSLSPGQALDSADGRFTLFMRRGGLDGGNLEIVGPGGFRHWASSSQNNPGVSAHFQMDENFVVGNGASTLWASRTASSGAAYGLLGNDGHFTLYTATNAAIWSTQTMLSVGVRLELPRELVSLDNRTRLSMQANGNLELLVGGAVRWSSATQGNPGAHAELLENGNFVVRNGVDILWESRTVGSGAVFVQLEDGYFTLRTRDGTEVWSTYRLNLGGRLTSGQRVVSRNGQYTLSMQPNGSLEFRNAAGRLLWTSPTADSPDAYVALLGNGNFVVRNGVGILWESRTAGLGVGYLQVEDDGYFALYTLAGAAVWSSRSMLSVGVTLNANEALVSLNGQFRLVMQPNGSLEFRNAADRLLWASPTANNPGAYAELLPDGNFVVRNGANILWESRTAGSGAVFVQAEDGFFTLRTRDGTAVWSSRSMLSVGVTLNANEALVSLNGQFRLVMQPNGNLELLPVGGTTILWTSFTFVPGNPGPQAELLPDGNFIVRVDTRTIWMSITANSNAAFVQVQDDGSFALYRADGSLVRLIP